MQGLARSNHRRFLSTYPTLEIEQADWMKTSSSPVYVFAGNYSLRSMERECLTPFDRFRLVERETARDPECVTSPRTLVVIATEVIERFSK